jgi:hypothetical protein
MCVKTVFVNKTNVCFSLDTLCDMYYIVIQPINDKHKTSGRPNGHCLAHGHW